MPAPANDNFADALELVGNSGSEGPTTIDEATAEPGEPFGTNGPGAAHQTIWFKLVTGEDRHVIVDTQGSDIDTVLAVWRGSELDSLVEVSSNDDSGDGGLTSLCTFDALAGETYYIQAGSFGDGASGVIVLNWVSLLAAPAPYEVRELGEGIKVDDVADGQNSVPAAWGYLGRTATTLRFAWFEIQGTGPLVATDGPKVREWQGGAWTAVGSGDPAAELELEDTHAWGLPTPEADHLVWLRSDGILATAWDGSGWALAGGPPALADVGNEYATPVDADRRLNLLAGGDTPGIYRWDGAAWSLVGDPFPGSFPEQGDSGTGARTASLVAHPSDADKLAVVLSANDSAGAEDSSVGAAVFFFDGAGWSAGVCAALDDPDMFENNFGPGGGELAGVFATCSAAVGGDGTIYVAVNYEAPGAFNGPVSVLSIPWDGSGFTAWPDVDPANRALAMGDWLTDFDSLGLASIAVNAAGAVALVCPARASGDGEYSYPVAIAREGSAWLIQQLVPAGSAFDNPAHILPGSASDPEDDAFLVAVCDGLAEAAAWHVYELGGPADFVDADPDGICFSFGTGTQQTPSWTRVDDPSKASESGP